MSDRAENGASRHSDADEIAAIYDSAPIGLCLLDRDLCFVRINTYLADANGLAAADHIGRSVREIMPDRAEMLEPLLRRVLAGESLFGVEGRSGRAGTMRIWRENLTPHRNVDGEIVGISIAAMDISGESAPAESGQVPPTMADFQTLADNLSQLAWMAEPDGHVLWYNRRWYEYTGGSPDTMIGWGWVDAHHPDRRDDVVAKWREHLAHGEPWEDMFPLRGANGEYRWFLSRAEPIRNPQGAIIRWFGTNTDVTDQVETAAALSRSEAQIRTMFDALPAMVFVCDPNGGNHQVNEAYCSFTGKPMGELLGDGWIEILHPDDQGRAREIRKGAMKAKNIYMAEHRFRRADGVYRWHIVRGLPLREEDGVVVSWIGACIDIHEHKMAEEKLHRRVESAAAEREAALFQLHESQKLETVGQLTGGVAHDFNNLLTPIVGSLDLLRRRITDESSARLIDGALASAERARTLIQRLLAFARRQAFQPRAVDPEALVSSMRDLIERSLGPRIEFVADIQPGLPAALIDPNQLELALLNLSVNARDAMPSGGRLTWTLAEESLAEDREDLKAGRYVRIAVTDTGIGMSEETLGHAVEAFFSTKAVGKGTGLGLSTVHELAANSGGAFRLESVLGEGTTAILWLPVATEEVVVPVREPAARAASRSAVVLLVDDEDQVRFTTAESLTELGYDVISAGSGQEALNEVEAGLTPDLLVTDHLMPGMTGAQLAMEMRQILPDLPVLVITGYAQLRPEEAGGFDVLVKPYRYAELALRIADLLSEPHVVQRTLS